MQSRSPARKPGRAGEGPTLRGTRQPRERESASSGSLAARLARAARPPATTQPDTHLAQHFAPAVALPRRGVDNNPRDLGSRVRVVVMVVRGRRGHLGLGLPVFRGLLRSLLLRVPAASFAQRLLAHLGASGGLVGDSPQEFHRGPATREH